MVARPRESEGAGAEHVTLSDRQKGRDREANESSGKWLEKSVSDRMMD